MNKIVTALFTIMIIALFLGCEKKTGEVRNTVADVTESDTITVTVESDTTFDYSSTGDSFINCYDTHPVGDPDSIDDVFFDFF